MSSFLADKSVLAIKPQSDANTPVIPTIQLPFVTESIRVNPNFEADRRMKGLDWKSDEVLRGSRTIEGDIVLYGDVETLAHLFNMTYAKGSTTGSGSIGYTHPFTVGEGKSYTIEFKRDAYAQRFFGVRGDNVKVEYENNKAKATIHVIALGEFYAASLAAALSGASTSAVLSTEQDPRPAAGLVAGDVLIIGGTEVTLTSISSDKKTVNFASTSITAAAGSAVFLKAQAVSLATQRKPLSMASTLVGIGADSSAADTAAGDRATATPCYQIATTLKNNTYSAPATGYSGAAAILNQVREAEVTLRRLFTDPTQYQEWIERVKTAITVIATGEFIASDLSTSESLTVKYHKTKKVQHEEALETGSYVFDAQTFEALYDATDGKAVEITIVNRTAGTAY